MHRIQVRSGHECCREEEKQLSVFLCWFKDSRLVLVVAGVRIKAFG